VAIYPVIFQNGIVDRLFAPLMGKAYAAAESRIKAPKAQRGKLGVILIEPGRERRKAASA
jgi:hypothetical protein